MSGKEIKKKKHLFGLRIRFPQPRPAQRSPLTGYRRGPLTRSSSRDGSPQNPSLTPGTVGSLVYNVDLPNPSLTPGTVGSLVYNVDLPNPSLTPGTVGSLVYNVDLPNPSLTPGTVGSLVYNVDLPNPL